jgi:hypothetical protein
MSYGKVLSIEKNNNYEYYDKDKYDKVKIICEKGELFIYLESECCSESFFFDNDWESLIGKNIKNFTLFEEDEIEIPDIYQKDIDESGYDVLKIHLSYFYLTKTKKFYFLWGNDSNGYYDGYIYFIFNPNTNYKFSKKSKLIIIVGLPGSGKTELLKKFNGFIKYDDFLDEHDKFESILQDLIKGEKVVCSDPRLINYKTYFNLFDNLKNKIKIETIVYENNSKQCIINNEIRIKKNIIENKKLYPYTFKVRNEKFKKIIIDIQ